MFYTALRQGGGLGKGKDGLRALEKWRYFAFWGVGRDGEKGTLFTVLGLGPCVIWLPFHTVPFVIALEPHTGVLYDVVRRSRCPRSAGTLGTGIETFQQIFVPCQNAS